MPTLNRGLNKLSLNNQEEYVVESQNNESSVFLKVSGDADVYATNYQDQESLLANLTEGDNHEVTWGLYKSIRIVAGEAISLRMIPRRNKIKGGIRNIQQLGDVPNFNSKHKGRFLVGNSRGKYEWGKLNPAKHFSGIRSRITPSISSVICILDELVAKIEIKGSGFYLDTKFYLYEDQTGSVANLPNTMEIENPANYSNGISGTIPSDIPVYAAADLDTIEFVDEKGFVGGAGVDTMDYQVFQGYGKAQLYLDKNLTAGKDYHVLAVSSNGKKKLYKNLISL